MPVQITPLLPAHLPAAAEIVASRCRSMRQKAPLMPAQYGDASAYLDSLARTLESYPGAAAIQDGELRGFLIAFLLPEFHGQPAAYAPEWGSGTAGPDAGRIIGLLYQEMAARWVSTGARLHLLSLFADDQLGLSSWNHLGFGLTGADAVRSLAPINGAIPGLSICRATAEDVPLINQMDAALTAHMAAAPAYWLTGLDDYTDWFQEEENCLFIAFDGGEAVGFIALQPGHPDGCRVLDDPGGVKVSGAFTYAPYRGKGVASALLDHGLAWASASGYSRCTVDYETMNISANRFWPRYFQPVCYALSRAIDPRAGSWRPS